MKISVYSLPKYTDLNEDAWFIPADLTHSINLCDGASESYDSMTWARLLSTSLTDQSQFSPEWLQNLASQYENMVQPDTLSWSKQLAYERGSFSTFLSAQIRDKTCKLIGIGDTVAFKVDGQKILETFPYTSAVEFLQRPTLLCTKGEYNPDLANAKVEFTKEFSLDDASDILLLTDALAWWLMTQGSGSTALQRLLTIESQEEFGNLIVNERKNGLRFDDTTMIRISLTDNSSGSRISSSAAEITSGAADLASSDS